MDYFQIQVKPCLVCFTVFTLCAFIYIHLCLLTLSFHIFLCCAFARNISLAL